MTYMRSYWPPCGAHRRRCKNGAFPTAYMHMFRTRRRSGAGMRRTHRLTVMEPGGVLRQPYGLILNGTDTTDASAGNLPCRVAL